MCRLAGRTRAHVFEHHPTLPPKKKKKLKYFDTNVEEMELNNFISKGIFRNSVPCLIFVLLYQKAC